MASKAPNIGLRWVGLLVTMSLGGCEPAYVGTVWPEDVSYLVGCTSSCGLQGRERGLAIAVGTEKVMLRRVSVCCEHLAGFAAQLQTIRDLWCDGLEVSPKTFGELTVGTTVSELSGQRGATLDQGEGYVAFNCGEWLDGLLAKVQTTPCCDGPAAANTR